MDAGAQRSKRFAGTGAVIVLWCAGLGALITWSDSDAAIAPMIGISVLAGLLVGRWLLATGALAFLTIGAVLLMVTGYTGDSTCLSPGALAVFLYLYSVVLVVIPAALGVGAQRLCASWRGVPDAIR